MPTSDNLQMGDGPAEQNAPYNSGAADHDHLHVKHPEPCSRGAYVEGSLPNLMLFLTAIVMCAILPTWRELQALLSHPVVQSIQQQPNIEHLEQQRRTVRLDRVENLPSKLPLRPQQPLRTAM